jgi:hypothetical protein
LISGIRLTWCATGWRNAESYSRKTACFCQTAERAQVTPATAAIRAWVTADATPRLGPDGLIRIWLDPKFADWLGQMRGPGESYSDVILRLAEA